MPQTPPKYLYFTQLITEQGPSGPARPYRRYGAAMTIKVPSSFESKTNIPFLSNKQRILGVAAQQRLAVAQAFLEALARPSTREHRALEECARVEQ